MRIEEILEKDLVLSEKLRLKNTRGIWRYVFIFFAHSGDSWFWLIALLLIWFLGKPVWHARASFLIIGMVMLATVVILVKFSIKRPRPEGDWGSIYRSTDPHSFPSGHAARAAALAVMTIGVGPTWLAIILVVWAPLVGLARVILGVHFLSDVVVGLLIGILTGVLALALLPALQNWLPFIF